jgi:uncharacterized protein (TIGR03382 family)
MRTCLIMLMTVAMTTWAQDLPDSGLPDASVEEGSAEGMSEENDPQGGPCLDSKDCSQGFACSGQRCIPVKPKNLGCSALPPEAVPVAFVAAVVGMALRRRRRS